MGTRERKIIIMKKTFIVILLCLSFYTTYAQGYIALPPIQYQTTKPTPSYSNGQLYLPDISYDRIDNVLEDGWYEATVTYNNPNSGKKSVYTLNVKVFDDKVTTIRFGNEGSLHSGYNSSGYTYSGGNLTFYQNNNGNVIAADTKVYIYQNGYTTTYIIEL